MKITAPSIFELAQIAGSLSRNSDDSTAALANRAMDLWFSCADKIQRTHVEAKQAAEDAANPPAPLFKQPKQFPVSLEDALRLWLPNVKEPDRMKCYRDFLKAMQPIEQASHDRLKTGVKMLSVEDQLKKGGSHPFDEWAFSGSGHIFLAWRNQEIAKKRAVVGKKGGRKAAQSDGKKNSH